MNGLDLIVSSFENCGRATLHLILPDSARVSGIPSIPSNMVRGGFHKGFRNA